MNVHFACYHVVMLRIKISIPLENGIVSYK